MRLYIYVYTPIISLVRRESIYYQKRVWIPWIISCPLSDNNNKNKKNSNNNYK